MGNCHFRSSGYISEYKHLLNPITQDAGKISQEGYPRDTLHVPSKGNLLQPHYHYSTGTAYDEHRTSHTRTIGQQLPEDTVNSHVPCGSYGIHSHTACHQRHIVYYRREHTDNARYQIVIATEHLMQSLPHHGQHTDGFQTGNSHQYAQEEEDGGHVDARKYLRYTLQHGTILVRHL